jgi:hypothetical protein
MRRAPTILVSTLLFAGALSTGCVRRTVMVTSAPAGALVYLNDREVGRTPCEVDITYYGRYDVRLVRDGCEPVMTYADANPPVWDMAGPDLLAAVAPLELRSASTWHFDLEPAVTDPASMAIRAREMRDSLQPAVDAAGETAAE